MTNLDLNKSLNAFIGRYGSLRGNLTPWEIDKIYEMLELVSIQVEAKIIEGILSGDEELLKFDRILLSTIYEIYNINPNFDSTKTLINNYYTIYQDQSDKKICKKEFYDKIYQSLLRAQYDRIIDGNINRCYDLNLNYLNLKELANYEDIGKEYANKVLQIKK